MKLSVIIPTKDRESILHKTLACAIEAIGELPAEIIVVNDSKDSSPDMARYEGHNVTMLSNKRSGVASARNTGAAKAKADLLLFLDDDIMITSESLRQILTFHEENRDVCVNPNWIYPDALQRALRERPFGRFLIRHQLVSFKGWYKDSRWRDNAVFESPLVASFHLSICKKDFVRARGYDENFPYAGFEDYDFPVRLRNMGLKLVINTNALVYHNEEDRQDLTMWIQRQKRGAYTRRVGVETGYKELALSYGPAKKILIKAASRIEPFLLWVAGKIPNSERLDFIYFRLVLALQVISIFEGYHEANATFRKS
jgi:glycosyltransferase involved in cell wall biosynthesis